MKKLPLALLCVAFLLLCVAHHAIGADEALPADAQKLVTKCDEDITKARHLLITSLTKAQEKATKSGNLAAANAIKAKIDTVAAQLGESNAPLTTDAAEVARHTSTVVMMYSLPDFKGPAVTVKTLDVIMDATAAGIANDALRSIKVPEGFTVTIFEGENGGGAMRVLTADTTPVGNVGGSGMSSFIIQRAK